jgi:hypothetical protein
VVTVLQVPRESGGQEVACPAIGAERTVDVVLADPLGDRTVVNLADEGVVARSVPATGLPVR